MTLPWVAGLRLLSKSRHGPWLTWRLSSLRDIHTRVPRCLPKTLKCLMVLARAP